ncbi:autotransporter domain-containing protein [Thorsellia anophelis]|uniref:Extended Signal Peptide of Type V secretion system n=1 Tax=Thorsellia anophelis DSM 18579 TaxID=1123402 RepID=A0A1I0ACS6_9GAMM|nr:autotransporter domain-containing protein [Thorsellia anophelis]SES92021.1 Extended Signal Peptide of Type V secretion system [Thorsellia anophelis DSM 18579]
MNKIYRVIRNQQSGLTQVVSELAKSCSGRNNLVKLAIISAIGLTSANVAAGGNGGFGGGHFDINLGPGSVGVLGGAGGDGGVAQNAAIGGVKGNVGGAGGQSDLVYISDVLAGGNGASTIGTNGGAGGGGTGFNATDSITIDNGKTIIGGAGGVASGLVFTDPNGTYLGNNAILRGGGGGAGAGLVTQSNLVNNGNIKGGAGGMGASGGGGGAGLIATNTVIENTGTIEGGQGGQGNVVAILKANGCPTACKSIADAIAEGLSLEANTFTFQVGNGGQGEGGAAGGRRATEGANIVFGKYASAGAGGSAIVGENITLYNTGIIKAGVAGIRSTDDGAVLGTNNIGPSDYLKANNPAAAALDGYAIWLKNGNNKLVLGEGSDIQGAIHTDNSASTLTILKSGTISGLTFTGMGANTLQFSESFITKSDGAYIIPDGYDPTPVETTLSGDLVLNDNSTVKFRLSGNESSKNDKLNIDGKAFLTGANLALYPIDEIIESRAFALGEALSFNIIAATELEGEFNELEQDGFWYTDLNVTYQDGNVNISLQRDDTKDSGGEDGGDNGGGQTPEIKDIDIQAAINSNASRVWNELQSVVRTTDTMTISGWASEDNLSKAIRQIIYGNNPVPRAIDFDLLTPTQREQLLGTASMLIAGEIHPTATTAMKNKALTSLDYEFEKTRYNLMSDTPEDEWPLWIDFHTAKQDLSGELAASADIRTSGVTFGGDIHMGTFRLGASVGYDNGNLEMHGQPGHADTRTMNLAMYGGTVYDLGNAKVNWMSGFNYQQNKVETKRAVAFANFEEVLSAKYDVDSISLATEVGYQYPLSKQSHVEPFLNLAYHKYSIGDISESELSSGLRSRREGQDVVSSKVGTRVSNNFQVGTATGNVNATLAWRHNMGDTESYSDMTLIGNGASFQTRGIEMDENAMIVGAGTVVDVGDSLKLGLNYNGEFGSSRNENAAKVDLRWTF